MVLQTMVAWAFQYNECAERHNSLVDFIEGDPGQIKSKIIP
jgi:hypothetical protein